MASGDKKRATAALSEIKSKRHLKAMPAGATMMEVLLLGFITHGSSLASAKRALAKIKAAVVNWNELRVMQVEDVAALLAGMRDAQSKATAMHDVLASIFEQTHDLEFAFLEGASTEEAKDFLSGLSALTDEIVDEFVLAGRGHFTIAADNGVVRVLKRLGLSGRSEAPAKVQEELEKLVGGDRCYQIIYLARQLAENVCVPHGPRCPECPVAAPCPSARKSKRK